MNLLMVFLIEMGIESPIMLSSEGTPFDNLFELPNGCLCCSAKDELYKVI